MKNPDKSSAQPAAIRTVGRVFSLLERLVESPAPMRLTDVARELDLAPASAHSLLHRLAKLGYVECPQGERKYRVGHKLVRLAVRVVEHLEVEPIARPHLEALAKRTGEDIYLALPQPDGVVYVAKVEGSQSLRLNIRLGILRPLHSTAIGRLYLAMQPDEEIDRYLETADIEALTPATITDPAALRRSIELTRAAGYAVSEQQTVEGICAVSIPIFDGRERFAAGLTISAPASRFATHRAQFIADGTAAARAISIQLGSGAQDRAGVA